MKCPKCKTVDLGATKLEEGLVVNGCKSCGGAMISLLYYRDWAERTMNDRAESLVKSDSVMVASDSQMALSCPKCLRLMTKFNISGDTKNKLDLCTNCDESWVDGGEWELLQSLHLSKKMPSVFTESWQRKVRTQITEQKRKARLAKVIGEEEMKQAESVKSWLKDHKNRAEILFYLGQD